MTRQKTTYFYPADLTPGSGSDPYLITGRATQVASALAAVVQRQKLYKDLDDSRHLYVEAWQTCGWLVGITARVCPRHEDLVDASGKWMGVRFYAEALDRDSRVISSGHGLCTLDESHWEGRDRFQVESMAQTRAISKALRDCLAWIVVLAGFSPTPAEEMTDRTATAPTTAPRPSRPKPKPERTDLSFNDFWLQAWEITGARQPAAVHQALGVETMKQWVAQGKTLTNALDVLKELTSTLSP